MPPRYVHVGTQKGLSNSSLAVETPQTGEPGEYGQVINTIHTCLHQVSCLLSLYPALFLILLLTTPTPFWGYIDAILFFLVALFLGFVNCCRLVLSWRVNRIQDQWGRSLVQELMLGSCRHNHHIAGLDFLLLAGNLRETLARCEGKDLIDGMNLRLCKDTASCIW